MKTLRGVSPSFPAFIVHPRKQERGDLLRRIGLQRALGERDRNGAQAQDAVELERIGRFPCEDVEVPADGPSIAARDRAPQAARRAEPLHVVRGAAQKRQERGERVGLRDAELAPQRDGLPDERDDEGAGEIGRGVIQDRKSTRLNSSHMSISYAVFCLKKKK